MSSQEYIFTVSLPLEDAWQFMLDRVMVSRAFPGCKDVRLLNDTDSIWTVTFSLGPFSRTVEFQGHTTELKKNERMAWIASHPLFSFSGVVSFRRISEKETEITYHMSADVTGTVPFLQDLIAGERMKTLGSEFIRNLKRSLEQRSEKRG